jgi:hypothetical protein
MADLGDLQQAYSQSAVARGMRVSGVNQNPLIRLPRTRNSPGRNSFTTRALGIAAACTGAVSGDIVVLLESGQLVQATRAIGGVAYFYDLDDGAYFATSAYYEMAWRVVVVEGVVTVTVLSGGGGTGDPEPMYSSIG